MQNSCPKIDFLCEDENKKLQAEKLAAKLGLSLSDSEQSMDYSLALTPERLELRQNIPTAPGPVFVDFASAKLHYRRQFGGGRKEPLAKAVGLKANRCPFVVDATAGLGRDAFMLASLGCRVHLLERSPLVAALLQDGLDRAAHIDELADIMSRISLEVADATTVKSLPARTDIIYLDPMYPHRSKNALVKKEMRLVRALVGDDQDASQLLCWALSFPGVRVVVKRPKGAPTLTDRKPPTVITSKNSRFDVYL
ncbi:MAG: class I SAM-dependent methyltransferase [Desulfobulbaceae bacterium]|nr:class I SAM-dependent methyltransferase [Desulfobulbaceae bacterium]